MSCQCRCIQATKDHLVLAARAYIKRIKGMMMNKPRPQHSAEANAKRSQKQLERWRDPKYRENQLDCLHSQESVSKRKETIKRKWQDPEYRRKRLENMSTSKTGFLIPTECPHCGKTSKNKAIMMRWHFDKCKHREMMNG